MPASLTQTLMSRSANAGSLRLVTEGLANRWIAEGLVLSVGTVKAHLHNIHGMLGVKGRMQTIARAWEIELI